MSERSDGGRCGGDRRRTADEDAGKLKSWRRAGQSDRQRITRRMADDRRRTLMHTAAGRSVFDTDGASTSMIGTATMFGTCAVFSGLCVAQVLLLLPLRSTVLEPYLDLHPIILLNRFLLYIAHEIKIVIKASLTYSCANISTNFDHRTTNR